jgi:hypothetical protein
VVIVHSYFKLNVKLVQKYPAFAILLLISVSEHSLRAGLNPNPTSTAFQWRRLSAGLKLNLTSTAFQRRGLGSLGAGQHLNATSTAFQRRGHGVSWGKLSLAVLKHAAACICVLVGDKVHSQVTTDVDSQSAGVRDRVLLEMASAEDFTCCPLHVESNYKPIWAVVHFLGFPRGGFYSATTVVDGTDNTIAQPINPFTSWIQTPMLLIKVVDRSLRQRSLKCVDTVCRHTQVPHATSSNQALTRNNQNLIKISFGVNHGKL